MEGRTAGGGGVCVCVVSFPFLLSLASLISFHHCTSTHFFSYFTNNLWEIFNKKINRVLSCVSDHPLHRAWHAMELHTAQIIWIWNWRKTRIESVLCVIPWIHNDGDWSAIMLLRGFSAATGVTLWGAEVRQEEKRLKESLRCKCRRYR